MMRREGEGRGERRGFRNVSLKIPGNSMLSHTHTHTHTHTQPGRFCQEDELLLLLGVLLGRRRGGGGEKKCTTA